MSKREKIFNIVFFVYVLVSSTYLTLSALLRNSKDLMILDCIWFLLFSSMLLIIRKKIK